MSMLRKLIKEFHVLGHGGNLIAGGVAILLAVLTLLGRVYLESDEEIPIVDAIVWIVLLIAVSFMIIGFWLVRQFLGEDLLTMGMIGRRSLEGDKILEAIQKANSIIIIKTWFPETEIIRDALKAALKNGASVELILCDPYSKILEHRCEGARVNLDEAQLWIKKGLMIVEQNARNPGQFLGVRFHDIWPGCPVIRADQRTFMGFYLRGNTSPNLPWIEIHWPSNLRPHLERQERELRDCAVIRKRELKTLDDLRSWLKNPAQHWKNQP